MTEHKIIIADARDMKEVKNESVQMVITSPPYWSIKDYGVTGQIGYDQTLHQYLKDLYSVWKETYRVLAPGSRLCINIGDQFLRSIVYGRYKIAPLHSEFISQCEKIGFDYMGSIIWQKKTTMNTTGGANVMGSYPYPPNGLIEIDYEFILIFKKQGRRNDISMKMKEESKLSKEEWKEYFNGHWAFSGERQIDHQAMFPEELPKRLIKMFSFVGDTVLDPFLGSGTTSKVALDLNRNSIGYEINQEFLPTIKKKVGIDSPKLFDDNKIEIVRREKVVSFFAGDDYSPTIQDAEPVISPDKFKFEGERLYKVGEILKENLIKLDTGLMVKFLGVSIPPSKKNEAIKYLEEYAKGKQVFLKFDPQFTPEGDTISAYVFLKNKIFLNKELLKKGIGEIAPYNFRYREVFANIKLEDVQHA
ncbi:MAG: DNA-methyltransferase [Cuniculiplasma sp.]